MTEQARRLANQVIVALHEHIAGLIDCQDFVLVFREQESKRVAWTSMSTFFKREDLLREALDMTSREPAREVKP